MPDNPFLDSSFHIRWSALKPALVEPAMDAALARAEAALAAIEGGEGPPTFENTLLALDDATEALNRAWSRVTHLQSVADSPELREAHNRVLPRVSAFLAGVPLRPALWARLRAFAALSPSLPPVRARFMGETLAEFREAGADLPAGGRARLEALQSELAQLTQRFSDNVLDATNAWQLVVTDEVRLAGLPAHAKARALADAQAKGIGDAGRPAWRFTLHAPSAEPFMTYVADDALRERDVAGLGGGGLGPPHDNDPLIPKILELRAERARLLGKGHFADLVLARRMAKTGATALQFVDDFRVRCAAAFARECRELEESKARDTGQPPARLAPWEIAFRAERLRRAHYDFDEEELRPYFPMDRVMPASSSWPGASSASAVSERPRGGRDLASRRPLLRRLRLTRPPHRVLLRRLAPEGVEARGGLDELPDHRGPAARRVAPAAPGPHLRQHDAPGAGAAGPPLAPRGRDDLPRVRPPAAPPPGGGRDQVAQRDQRGVGLRRAPVADHGELVLGAGGPRHVRPALRDGRADPGGALQEDDGGEELQVRVLHDAPGRVRQDGPAPAHPGREFSGAADVEARVRALIADCLVPTEPPAPTIVRRFTHIFSDPVGYAAGYYSYKWAEVLDADAFTRFRREGIFNERVGREFVETILSRGNSADPAELFRDFMGRDPDPGALLERSGLAT
jgi:oligopeptidase A